MERKANNVYQQRKTTVFFAPKQQLRAQSKFITLHNNTNVHVPQCISSPIRAQGFYGSRVFVYFLRCCVLTSGPSPSLGLPEQSPFNKTLNPMIVMYFETSRRACISKFLVHDTCIVYFNTQKYMRDDVYCNYTRHFLSR